MNFLENYYNNYDGVFARPSWTGGISDNYAFINEILKGNKSKRILEVGAGTGRYSVTLAKEGYEMGYVKQAIMEVEKIH